jgi:hypothetical protein
VKRFHLLDPAASAYAATVYGDNKRDALNRYREQWYPGKRQLPKGVSIWETPSSPVTQR